MKYFIIIICLLSLVACWEFSYDFFVGDSANQQIINAQGTAIKCIQSEFDDYGCLHKDNIKALKQWIQQNCDQENTKVLNFIFEK